MSRTCTRDAAGQAGRGAVIPSKIHTLSSSGMRCVATARMRARLVVTQCGRPGDLAFTVSQSDRQQYMERDADHVLLQTARESDEAFEQGMYRKSAS